ncbi:MAG: hypothetical protein DWI29_04260, partial [Planctomycetota bacterium]
NEAELNDSGRDSIPGIRRHMGSGIVKISCWSALPDTATLERFAPFDLLRAAGVSESCLLPPAARR